MTGAQHVHSLMRVRRDLRQGMVAVGVRFHDIRTADNLLLTGNVVRFTHRGRRYSVDVEDAIADVDAAEQGDTLTLRHSSELFFKPRSAAQRLGRISYVYTIDARSMLFGVEAVLEVDPGADVADVEMTIAHDHLSHGINDVRYDTVAAEIPGAAPRQLHRGGARAGSASPAAGASYYSMAQAEIAGFALAIHTAPRQPERLTELEVHVAQPGKLHLVRACYRFPGPCRGARLAIGEDKLLDRRRLLFAHRRIRRADARCGGREPDPARRPRLQRLLRLRRRDQRLRQMLRGRRGGAAIVPAAARLRPSCAACSTGTPTIISTVRRRALPGQEHDHVAPAGLCDPRRS